MLIEKVIKEYLEAKLGVKVELEVPKNKPSEYITLKKIDGGLVNQISAATIEVHSCAESKFKAAELDEKVREELLNIADDEECDISSAELGGNSDDADTRTKQYRYRSVFNFYY